MKDNFRWLVENLISPLFKTLLAPLTLLVAGTVLSAVVIPGIISDSSELESLNEARLKKAIAFGDRNEDFISKLNVLKTLMLTFHEQNVRMTTSPAKLREAQLQFRKDYTEKYLSLDSAAWWWYWDVEREAQIFNLLSPSELKLLHDETLAYGASVLKSKNAIDPLWHYLSSSRYGSGPVSRKEFEELTAAMTANLKDAGTEQSNHVYNISELFAKSRHRRPRKSLFQRIFSP